ncbi:MAG: helix-turn-helix transcriptional regulator [Polyangiales bacterium]
MTPLGRLIEARRAQLGMSRPTLAQRVGVSVQTILNVERDENYNLGTKLIRQIEAALGVEFVVTIQETTMEDRIAFGIDECILYVRKNYPSNATPNNQIAKQIAEWLRSQPAVDQATVIREQDVPCLWGGGFAKEGRTGLPATAAQLSFPRALLPGLFTVLDNVGRDDGAPREALATRSSKPHSEASAFDPESVIMLFTPDEQRALRWIRAQIEQEWEGDATRWGQPAPKEAWLSVTGEIQVRFLPYDGPTGHHVAIWTGEERRARGVELVQRLLDTSLEQIERWGRNTHSINIPVAELASLERRFAFMSVVAALAAKA